MKVSICILLGYLVGYVSGNEIHCFDCIFKTGIVPDYNGESLSNLETNGNHHDAVVAHVFDLCMNLTECRRSLAETYLKTKSIDCNGDSSIDCFDYALFAEYDSQCLWAPMRNINSTTLKMKSCLDQDANITLNNASEAKSQSSSSYTTNDLEPTTEGYEKVGTIVPAVVTKLVGKECLRCICEATNNCDTNATCNNTACGPYQLSLNYYQLAGSPGNGFESCCGDIDCSQKVIQAYVSLYLTDCDSNELIDCDDFAAIHRFGESCSKNEHKLTEYWHHFEYCTVMADNVRREVDPWENSPKPSVNQPSISLPPLVPYPVRFSTKAPINLPDRLDSQLINLDNQCLNCICQASSGCNITRTQCPSGSNCGPFQIDLSYIKEAGGELLTDDGFNDCANSKECSENIVKNYIERNVLDCNEDEILDCTDFALVHKLGRSNCRQAKEIDTFLNSAYWTEFQECHGFD